MQTWASVQEEGDVRGGHARVDELLLRVERLQVLQPQPRDLRRTSLRSALAHKPSHEPNKQRNLMISTEVQKGHKSVTNHQQR